MKVQNPNRRWVPTHPVFVCGKITVFASSNLRNFTRRLEFIEVMSDNEDDEDDDNSEDDDVDDEEQVEEEDDEEEEVDEEELKKKKLELVNDDIMLIKDIFKYIDQTSKRIVDKFNIEREMAMKTAQAQRKEQLQQHHDSNNPDLSWSQYENLDEAQRAELLEKAIMVLAQD